VPVSNTDNRDIDLCPCGKTQRMSYIVEYCPLTKLNGGLSRLHSADEDAIFLADQLWSMTRVRERKKESNTVWLKLPH